MANINYKNFKNICRTCMLSCDINFTKDAVILDIYYKLTDIRFETNDELPQQICLKCFEKINEIHTFSFLCKRTHTALLECLNKHKLEETQIKEEILDEPNIEIYEMDQLAFEDIPKEEETKEEIDDPLGGEIPQQIPEVPTKLPEIIKNIKTPDNKKSLVKQYRRPSYPEKPLLKCPKCWKTYKFTSGLRNHVCAHDQRSYKCGKCSMTFKTEDLLRKHETHGGEHTYKCGQCSMSFIKLVAWNSHMNTHIKEKMYKCDLCNETFSLWSTLEVHMYEHI